MKNDQNQEEATSASAAFLKSISKEVEQFTKDENTDHVLLIISEDKESQASSIFGSAYELVNALLRLASENDDFRRVLKMAGRQLILSEMFRFAAEESENESEE